MEGASVGKVEKDTNLFNYEYQMQETGNYELAEDNCLVMQRRFL